MLQSFASCNQVAARHATMDEDHQAALGHDLENIANVGRIQERLIDWAFDIYGSRQRGSSSRDIYNALFTPSIMHASLSDASIHPLDYEHIVQANPSQNLGSPGILYHILSISPRSDRGNDLFDFDFKSKIIAQRASKRINLSTYREAIGLLRFCRLPVVPRGASFAGCVFEALVHYALAGKKDLRRRIGDYHLMSTTLTSEADKPTYRWSMLPSSQPSPLFIPDRERCTQHLHFLNSSSIANVYLDEVYLRLLPDLPTNPLIDSLLVDFTCHSDGQVALDIWIYRISFIAQYEISEGGYEQVKCIIKAAQAYTP